jgi:hypothetical protein
MSQHVSSSMNTLYSADRNVDLPPGSRVTALIPHGAAYWTRTVMIRTEQSDSSPLDFFLKVRVFGA